MMLHCVGDVWLGDNPFQMGRGIRSVGRKDGYASFFEGVSFQQAEQDLVIGNLESVLSDPPPDTREFSTLIDRGEPKAAEALSRAGFTHFSLANNHIFEYGPEGLGDTADALDRHKLRHFGSRHRPYHIHDANGLRIGLLSWSLLPDPLDGTYNTREYYNVSPDIAPVLEQIEEVRPHCDRIVLSLHWGYEFMPQPSREQVATRRSLVDSGVDILLGHHSHVVQPVETYRTGLIAYSLGNFLMDTWLPATKRGVVLRVDAEDPTRFSLKHSAQQRIPDFLQPETRARARNP